MRQSFSYTLLITWVLIALSCKTQFVQKSYETGNISVSESENPLDSSIVQMYLPYKNILEKDMNRVISFNQSELKKDRPESGLTNFLGDLLLEEGAISGEKEGLVKENMVSFFNYGGIRTYLPKGDITVGKIFELMPFENQMVFLELKGTQMQEFLNYIARKGGDSIGGARIVIKDDKATYVEIGGKAIDLSQNYWLVTNDYVANGGDGLSVLREHESFINSGEKIREVIIRNLEKKQKNGEEIIANVDGRIKYDE